MNARLTRVALLAASSLLLPGAASAYASSPTVGPAQEITHPGYSASTPFQATGPLGGKVLGFAEFETGSGLPDSGKLGVVDADATPFGTTSWVRETKLADEQITASAIARADDGRQLAVFAVDRGIPPVTRAEVATRTPGKAWSAPIPVSGPIGWVGNAQAAFDAKGNAIVAWVDGDQVMVVNIERSGRHGKPIAIDGGASVLSYLRAARADDGTIALTWVASAVDGDPGHPMAAVRPAGKTTFDTPASLSDIDATSPFVGPEPAFADDGTMTVGWLESTGPTDADVFVTTAAAGGDIAPKEQISVPGNAANVWDGVSVAGGATTAVAWLDTTDSVISAATRSHGSSAFSRPRQLAATSNPGEPRVSIDGDGALAVAWIEFNGSGSEAFAITGNADLSRHTAEVPVGASPKLGVGYGLAMAPDTSGSFRLAWIVDDDLSTDDDDVTVESRTLTP